MSMYEEAIKIDPKYALAYAGMADARSFLFRYYRDSSIGYDALADEASRRPVELDPDSAVAHTARGTALRSEERRVGKECVSQFRARRARDHYKKYSTIKT